MVLNKSSGTTLKRVVMFFMAIFVFSIVLVGCSKKIENITLSKTDLVLVVGQTEQITVTVVPGDADIKTVAWSSEDPAVATVGTDGLITAVSNGKTVITATAGKVVAKLNLTVINPHSVTFNTDGGTKFAVQTVMHGAKASKPADPTKLGYTFGGWFKDAAATNAFSFDTAITADTIVYAKWTKKDYTITLNPNGGVEMDPVYADHGERVTSPVPTKTGHDFVAWYTDSDLSNKFNFNTQITEDLKLYAKWKLSTYYVKFNSNGGSKVADFELLYLQSASKPANPTKPGYEFEAWYKDADLNTLYDFASEVEGMTTVYAKWKPTESMLKFDTDGGSEVGDIVLPTLDILVQPEDPVKENHFFAGWYQDAAFTTPFDFNAPVIAPGTIYAKWQLDPEAFRTVDFNYNGGFVEISSTDPFVKGKPVSSYAVGYYDGGFWSGYKTDVYLMKTSFSALSWAHKVGLKKNAKGLFEVVKVIPGDGNLPDLSIYDYVIASHDEYPAGYAWITTIVVGQIITVTGFDTAVVPSDFKVNGTINVYPASAATSITQSYFELNAPIVTPKKVNSTFGGWYDNDKFEGEAVTKVTKEQKLYAKWILQHTVKFDVAGGSAIEDVIALDKAKLTAPKDPTKSGFVFDGWFKDAEFKDAFDFSTDIIAPTTIYAKWAPVVEAVTDYKGVLNGESWIIEVKTPGEDLDTTKVKSITAIKEAGVALETPVEIIPDTNKAIIFVVADKNRAFTVKEAGVYEYVVIRQDDTKYILTFDYNPEAVMGVRENIVVADINYKAVWNNDLGVWFIEVTVPGKALDESAVKSITLIRKASVDLETPEVITPNTNTQLLFGVAQADGAYTYKANGRYTIKVVNQDDTEYEFEFFYNSKFVTAVTQKVAFNANGGTAVEPVVLEKGTKLTKPVDPTKNGYEIEGWFTDAALKNVFNFDTLVTTDLTLYAKWKTADYTITYNYNGGKLLFANKAEMINGFLEDLYAFIKPTEDLVTFKHGAGKTSGYDGLWYSNTTYRAKIYDGPRPTGPNDSKNLFIYSSLYYQKWLPFFDMMESFIKLYSTQFFYGAGTYTGLLRLKQYITNTKPDANKYTDANMAMMPSIYVSPDKYTITTSATLPAPLKAGFVFGGWYTNAEFTGEKVTTIPVGRTGNVELFAKWLDQNTIKFDSQGGSAVADQKVGPTEYVIQPVDPRKAGYSFGGWYFDTEFSTAFDFSAPHAGGELVLYAKWNPNNTVTTNYKAVWNAAKGEYLIDVVVPGQALDTTNIKSITLLKKAGVALEKPVAITVTTDAALKFAVAKSDSDLAFTGDGLYVYEVVRKDNTKFGFSFNYKSGLVTGLTPVDNAKVNYKAVWNETRETWFIEVTAKELLDLATIKSFTDLRIAGKYVAPVVHEVNEDKTFWFPVANKSGSNGLSESGVYSYLVTRQDDTTYVLTFTYDRSLVEGLHDVVEAEVNYEAVWNAELGKWVIEVKVKDQDLDLAAIKELDLVQQGGKYITLVAQTVTESKVFLFDVATKNGDLALKEAGDYTFGVLRQDGTRFLFKFNYVKESVKNVTHEVLFDVKDGTEVEKQVIVKNELATKPATDPTRKGFTFGGWYKDAEFKTAFDFAAPITADTTVYAKWDAIKYDLFVNKNRGVVETEAQKTYTVEDEITLPIPTREGKIFGGWYESYKFAGDPITVIKKGSTGTIRVYAKWISIHTVTFNVDGGSEVVAQQIVDGNKATKPEVDPTKAGYTFIGWFKDAAFETAFDFDAVVKAPVTVYAKWDANVKYTVTFDVDGGSDVAALTVDAGAKVAKPEDPTKAGFVFAGWFKEATLETAFDFDAAVNADVTAYAKWDEAPAEKFATDLFFSEYIEGGSNNKALEIYNGTGKTVDLSAYKVVLYSNGAKADAPTNTLALTGTLAHGEVYVIYNAGSVEAVKNVGDIAHEVTYFNGDDAIVLTKNDVIIDSFGQLGTDPGSSWGANDVVTVNMTLVRKPNIYSGRIDATAAFDPSLEWVAYAQDTFTYLGSHTME